MLVRSNTQDPHFPLPTSSGPACACARPGSDHTGAFTKIFHGPPPVPLARLPDARTRKAQGIGIGIPEPHDVGLVLVLGLRVEHARQGGREEGRQACQEVQTFVD